MNTTTSKFRVLAHEIRKLVGTLDVKLANGIQHPIIVTLSHEDWREAMDDVAELSRFTFTARAGEHAYFVYCGVTFKAPGKVSLDTAYNLLR